MLSRTSGKHISPICILGIGCVAMYAAFLSFRFVGWFFVKIVALSHLFDVLLPKSVGLGATSLIPPGELGYGHTVGVCLSFLCMDDHIHREFYIHSSFAVLVLVRNHLIVGAFMLGG